MHPCSLRGNKSYENTSDDMKNLPRSIELFQGLQHPFLSFSHSLTILGAPTDLDGDEISRSRI